MAKTNLFGVAAVMDAAMSKGEKLMHKATVVVQGYVRRLINRGNSTGKSPSAPGEPPAKVTANLFRNINRLVVRDGQHVRGYVGTNVVYARRLELGFVGTDKKGRKVNQAPRPFLRPALYASRDDIREIFGSNEGTISVKGRL